MDHKKYGILLFNAVRETLETMAFAEVIPCSLMLGDEELEQDDFESGNGNSANGPVSGLDPEGAISAWPDGSDDNGGEIDSSLDSWGTPSDEGPADLAEDAWGDLPTDEPGDDWGAVPSENAEEDDPWGAIPAAPPASGEDPWGDVPASEARGMSPLHMSGKDIDFEQLVDNQTDWVWSCMRVNSEDVHSVWFIVSKNLAMQLARSMYAGEMFELDSPMIRDLVAELTNVLGGKLMLLLEELGGKFTLAVPEIGIGMPQIPEAHTFDSILCKVLVDSEYPVMSSICFNETANG